MFNMDYYSHLYL